MTKIYLAFATLICVSTTLSAQSIKIEKDDWKGEATVTADTMYSFRVDDYSIRSLMRSNANSGKEQTYWFHQLFFIVMYADQIKNIREVYYKSGSLPVLKGDDHELGSFTVLPLSDFHLQEIERDSSFAARLYLTEKDYLQIDFSENDVKYLLDYVAKVEKEVTF